MTSQLQGFSISLLFAGTALFVGAFLVFNALSMTVLERTRELGMLRALGSTRAMIARSVMAEALILGLLGSVLGVLFGYGMAKGLVYLSAGRSCSRSQISPSPLRARLRDRRRRRGHGRRSPLPGSARWQGKPRRGDARPAPAGGAARASCRSSRRSSGSCSLAPARPGSTTWRRTSPRTSTAWCTPPG